MAKRGNGRYSNKKRRGMPNVMSHKKHRSSGKSQPNKFARELATRDLNREAEVHHQLVQGRMTWCDSVSELFLNR